MDSPEGRAYVCVHRKRGEGEGGEKAAAKLRIGCTKSTIEKQRNAGLLRAVSHIECADIFLANKVATLCPEDICLLHCITESVQVTEGRMRSAGCWLVSLAPEYMHVYTRVQ